MAAGPDRRAVAAVGGLLALLGLAAGASYPAASLLLEPGTVAAVAWKGAGVGLLAASAWLAVRDRDTLLLALMMTAGAAGDVLIESSLKAGMAAFAAGHVAAVWLYLGNRHPRPPLWPVAVAIALCSVAQAQLPLDLQGDVAFTVYILLVGLMALTAAQSRFGNAVPVGALLFALSDLLIAASLDPNRSWARGEGTELAIWVLYFTGQALIFLGVRRGLSEPRAAA